MKTYSSHVPDPDAILVGSGIMSATLAAMLKRLDPALKIQVYELTEALAQEASFGWHNAGTGHAGLCELSYTPTQAGDGSVDVSNALRIFEEFEKSPQFWAYAVSEGMIDDPSAILHPVQHLSFVHGAKWVDYLRARHAAMSQHHFFAEMAFSTDPKTVAEWAPLLTAGRPKDQPIAATRMSGGTDVTFGEIARSLLHWLSQQPGCGVATNHRVTDLAKQADGSWQVRIRDLATGQRRTNRSKFVFIGAGGGSLKLLQKSGIKEAQGLGGFPIGGQWIVCKNPDVVAQHHAKVYGQPQDEAPTMAVPHLDSRVLDGKRHLFFGPFASWTTKFLCERGSIWDLPGSIRPHNLLTLLKIGASNLGLVKYLVQQGTQSMEDRMKVLRLFYPDAKTTDWELMNAGIRVQAIKKTDGEAGIVHYGTEVLTSEDRSISALLGASPGASTSVHIVAEVIQNCFPALLASTDGAARMKAMIPTYDVDIKKAENADFFREHHERAARILKLR